MHQDVWSRYSGGSGAPAWTLELVGFDLTALEETGAAYFGGVRDHLLKVLRGEVRHDGIARIHETESIAESSGPKVVVCDPIGWLDTS